MDVSVDMTAGEILGSKVNSRRPMITTSETPWFQKDCLVYISVSLKMQLNCLVMQLIGKSNRPLRWNAPGKGFDSQV